MEEQEKIENEDNFADFGEEQDFVAPNLDDLGEKIEEKEEDIIVPEFEDETQSLEENSSDTEIETIETPENSAVLETPEDIDTIIAPNLPITPEIQNNQTDSKETIKEVTEEINKEAELEANKEAIEKEKAQLLQQKYEENSQKLNHWEELNSENDIVKKYIIYVDKENVEAIDELSVDERNAFMNSAIKMKFESNDKEKEKMKKARLALHGTIMLCTTIIFMPIAFYLAHLSIAATFKNYKYSQDNFEKLYKESFANSPSYKKAQKYTKSHKN